MDEEKSSCPPYYPTACFELLHASTGSYVVAALQFVLLIVVGVTYYCLERKHYFVNVDAFRPVVACMGTLYATGTICAVIGVFYERRSLVHAHVTIVTSLMVFTDIIAVAIIIIMAIEMDTLLVVVVERICSHHARSPEYVPMRRELDEAYAIANPDYLVPIITVGNIDCGGY
ncbi:hypothetical protein KIN20_020318 [Parelaphostrongylus tenuis]|uniref:Uncharacterized protein n=1 Tax=Parelaphostrongylus tenuis TaxID=148309 RepID=A0AAD5N3Y6_PARTN|nr:hypothetical protein KIN20_020318 [Parelaphostrongylus tenuis]